MKEISEAVRAGQISGRVWTYANYDCNLACAYCLTESSPTAQRRQLSATQMLEIADEAKALGFTDLGVTGGEPFLRRWMPDLLLQMAERLPVLVLSNGTLFTGRRLTAMSGLAGANVTVQISLDRPDAAANDALRAAGNHAMVLQAIGALRRLGIRVRVASTVDEQGEDERARLIALVASLGVAANDHFIRPIVRRGRAATAEMGVRAELRDLKPELTISADGAFWGPFAPTVRGQQLDTDLLVSQTTRPLAVPAQRLVALATGQPDGHDAKLGIR